MPTNDDELTVEDEAELAEAEAALDRGEGIPAAQVLAALYDPPPAELAELEAAAIAEAGADELDGRPGP